METIEMHKKQIKPEPNGIWILGIIVFIFLLFFGKFENKDGYIKVYEENKDNPQFMKLLKESVETKR
jgi:hypothetical protein